MKLYNYFRSSAAYRVRIALNLKGVPYDYVPVHLVKDGGHHKKPEYQVRVNPDSRRVVQGARIGATIEARYFFGEPVANAKVTWVVHKSRYWLPYYDDFDDESGADRDSEYVQREQVSEESGVLDPEGKLRIAVPTSTAEYDLTFRIEARVTDEAGREISGASF